MPAKVTHVFSNAQLAFITQSPLGPVARDLLKRGARVQTRARRNLGGGTGSGPKRVSTGHLRASIRTSLIAQNGDLGVRVGSSLYYAKWVHDGTGIYGPRHVKITPRHARALVFRSAKFGRKSGKFAGFVVVKSVKGMRPNRYLKDALPAFHSKSS